MKPLNSNENWEISAWNGKRTIDLIDAVTAYLTASPSSSDSPAAEFDQAIDGVTGLQVTDEHSPKFGQFPLRVGSEAGDLNAVLFLMPSLMRFDLAVVAVGSDRVSAASDMVGRAIHAAEARWDDEIFDPHRDYKCYTNVFLLYIRAVLSGGLHTGSDRLVRKAHAQWKRWFFHISYNGVDEFVSPTYDAVDMDALADLHDQTPDPDVRAQIGCAIDYIATVGCAAFHPRLKLFVCGQSRHYHAFLTTGDCTPDWLKRRRVGTHELQAQTLAELDGRAFPFSMQGRAGTKPFRFQSWQTDRAAVGSMTGGHYFWQQVSWITAVGDDETSREIAWASGSYTPTPAFVDQSAGESLCVFVRAPHSLHRTQWKAQTPQPFSDFGIGITRGWTVEQNSHVTELRAFGHRLVVRPFTIVGETCVPVDLKRIHRTDRGQGRTHPGEADFDELIFPESAEIFGFHASLYGPDDQEASPEIVVKRSHDTLHVIAGARSVRLHTLPGGETVQTIETDSRSLPLVQCAARTIYAGEIL